MTLHPICRPASSFRPIRAITAQALWCLSVLSMPALAAGVNSSISTREDTPVPIPLANIANSPCTSITTVAVPGNGQGNVINNGTSLYVAGAPPTSCADIAAGLLSWAPGLNQTLPTVFRFMVDADPTVYTLTLGINQAVNDSPFLGTNRVNGSGFPGGNSPLTFPGWTFSSLGTNLGHAYGGVGFNVGNSPPGGILQQVMVTEPGTTYTVNFKINYGGFLTTDQRVTVSLADGSPNAGTPFGPLPGTALHTQTYGQQAGTQSFTFVAQSAQTTLRIADTTINGTTNNTDIAMEYINVQGPFAAQQLLEDGSLTFSGANLNSLAVSDPDGETTAYTLTASVAHGTLTPTLPQPPLVATPASGPAASYTFTGTLAAINRALEGMVYTPVANYNGPDALSLNLNDHGSNGASGVCPTYPATPTPQFCDLSTQQQLALTIVSVNDAPGGTDKLGIPVAQHSAYTFSAADFGFTDAVDAANTSGANALVAVQITTLPSTGTLLLAGAPVAAGQNIPAASIAQLTWTPAPGSVGNGVASFTFQVQDDGGTANGGLDLDASPNTISFNVSANLPPVAVNDSYTTVQDAPAITLGPLGNDSDPDGEPLHLVSLNGTVITPGTAQTIAVTNGVVTISATGAISFAPAAGFVGETSFPYVVADPGNAPATATVTITVKPVVTPAVVNPVPVGGAGFAMLMAALLAGLAGWRLRNTHPS